MMKNRLTHPSLQNEESDDSDRYMFSVSTTQFLDVWILDLGCSYHITPNREWFTSYRSANSGCVYLGDDRCCNIVGIVMLEYGCMMVLLEHCVMLGIYLN